MPVPAIAQAISAPATPVSCAKRDGSEKTPAPTIDPTTIVVRVSRVILTAAVASSGMSVPVRELVMSSPRPVWIRRGH